MKLTHLLLIFLLVADATFFGRRRDEFGVLVFKDIVSKEILIWKHIESEKIKDYVYLKDELLTMRFTINDIVIVWVREASLRRLMSFQYKCVTSTT